MTTISSQKMCFNFQPLTNRNNFFQPSSNNTVYFLFSPESMFDWAMRGAPIHARS